MSVFKFCNRNKHFISLAIWNMKKKIALWHLEKIGRFIFCSFKTFHIHIKQVLHFMVKRKRQQKQGFLAKKTKKLFIRRMLFFFFFFKSMEGRKRSNTKYTSKTKVAWNRKCCALQIWGRWFHLMTQNWNESAQKNK